jgi:hypothetical protein
MTISDFCNWLVIQKNYLLFELIEKNNPDWKDLYCEIVNGFPLSRE